MDNLFVMLMLILKAPLIEDFPAIKVDYQHQRQQSVDIKTLMNENLHAPRLLMFMLIFQPAMFDDTKVAPSNITVSRWRLWVFLQRCHRCDSARRPLTAQLLALLSNSWYPLVSSHVAI